MSMSRYVNFAGDTGASERPARCAVGAASAPSVRRGVGAARCGCGAASAASVDPDGRTDRIQVLRPHPVDRLVADAYATVRHRMRRHVAVTVDRDTAVEEPRPPQQTERTVIRTVDRAVRLEVPLRRD